MNQEEYNIMEARLMSIFDMMLYLYGLYIKPEDTKGYYKEPHWVMMDLIEENFVELVKD